jgi:hypothetical protein
MDSSKTENTSTISTTSTLIDLSMNLRSLGGDNSPVVEIILPLLMEYLQRFCPDFEPDLCSLEMMEVVEIFFVWSYCYEVLDRGFSLLA